VSDQPPNTEVIVESASTTSTWTPPPPPPVSEERNAGATLADRPEVAAGGAFAGGFVLALVLKRLARR
jgi:hypothetical protein